MYTAITAHIHCCIWPLYIYIYIYICSTVVPHAVCYVYVCAKIHRQKYTYNYSKSSTKNYIHTNRALLIIYCEDFDHENNDGSFMTPVSTIIILLLSYDMLHIHCTRVSFRHLFEGGKAETIKVRGGGGGGGSKRNVYIYIYIMLT